MAFSPALAAYLAASRLAGPLARLVLARRAARGREDPARLAERLGRAGAARPPGRLVWLHGASLGEALSMLPLIAELRRQVPDATCLVTTGTVASARRMAALLPPGCLHQFAPVDTAAAVRGFLGHWRPGLALWVESEFWPRLMVETARRGVPMALVNARVSARSARAWAWVPGMAAVLVRLFASITAQDAETVARLTAMGADPARLRAGANLKVLAPAPDCDPAELERLRGLLGGRPVWLAASTHAPEEEAVAEAHRLAARRLPGLLTILAPRHPARGGAIAEMLAGRGLACARRSAGEPLGAATEIWLADTFGEMGLWFRLAPVSFVGGSLAALGGHNPFEPAALGSAILHGPHTRNFGPAYAALIAAGASRRVTDGAALGRAVAGLMADPAARAAMTGAAGAVRRDLSPDIVAQAAALLALTGAGA
jgi:3-deoxy-D-manno-octulosonic-acid transferase